MSNPSHWQRVVMKSVGTHPDDYDVDALNWLANGPLCHASAHFCPAGKLSWADTKRREAQQWSAA